jgi:hypothetical protein
VHVNTIFDYIAFSDTVFSVNESVTDYRVTFFEHFSINIRNTTIHMSRVTQTDVTFEIKMYQNGTEAMFKGNVCVSFEMFTSQHDAVDFFADFESIASDGSRHLLGAVQFKNFTVHDKQSHKLTLLDQVMDSTNRILDSDGFLTIAINGSYVIHSQHTITTSPAKFNAQTHTSVDMSYTWTVCNITNPFSYCMFSNAFAGLGVAEFYIVMCPEPGDENFVSVHSRLAETMNTQVDIDQPFRARYRYELINNKTMERGVFDQLCMSDNDKNEYENVDLKWVATENFLNDDFVKSLRQNCVTIRFHVCLIEHL